MVGQDRTPFEIIRASRPERGGMEAPTWWSSRPGPAQRGGTIGWLTRPIHLRINRLAIAAVLIVFAAGLGVAYELGTRARPSNAGRQADARSAEQMSQLLASSVNRSLARDDQRAANDRNQAGETTAGGSRSRDPGVEAMQAEDRTPGLNYYCVMTLPASRRENAEKVAAFLRRNDVPADVVQTGGDGRGTVRVFALRGFERKSSPAAVDFKKKLTALGRAWKARGGFRGWNDTYLIKYRASD